MLKFSQCVGEPPSLDRDPCTLGGQSVDVWPFPLACSRDSMPAWEALLDEQERQRAGRFLQAQHRIEFIVAHGLVRHLLSRYTGTPPAQILFDHGTHGKPRLAGRMAPVQFNLTHSHGRGVLAVASMPVGVDLEGLRENIDVMEIAERYFFGTELAAIRRQPPALQRETFFRYWVAKESVLKAQGVGLGFPLDRFAVRFRPDDPDRASVHSDDPMQVRPDWQVRMIGSTSAWPAAVAARGSDWTLRVRALQEG